MPYPLERPYTRSGGLGMLDRAIALTEGPLLARSREMTRWHRVKAGVMLPHRTSPLWSFWCGQTGSARGEACATRDTLPTDGLPICGPCEGKALGAGYNGTAAILAGEALLLFEPESTTKFHRPSKCPGSKSTAFILPADVPADWRIKKCGLCGLHVPLGNGRGSPYNPDPPLLRTHQPYQLPGPCVFHAWDRMTVREGAVICECEVKR